MTNSINKQLGLQNPYTYNTNFNLKSPLNEFAKPNQIKNIHIFLYTNPEHDIT